MNILDDLNKIKSLDSSKMFSSIESLPDQIKQTWEDFKSIGLPKDYTNFDNIVFSGMGGSALGAYVCKYLYSHKFKQPLEIINDYYLPEYVNNKTLVIVGSYSGSTEETLSGLNKALEKKAKVFIITTGGKLEQEAFKHNIPYYKIVPKYNPCNQPRMAIGYSIFALISLFNKLSLIRIPDQDINELKSILRENNDKYGIKNHTETNEAKQLAKKLYGKLPILIAGEHLIGSIHAIRNQVNENAKSLAVYFPLPELNHHLLEALQFPEYLHEKDHYVLFDSNNYSEKIRLRTKITNEALIENGHTTSYKKFNRESKLSETIELIHFGSYVGYYMALLNDIDPSPIPWVEKFKTKLA